MLVLSQVVGQVDWIAVYEKHKEQYYWYDVRKRREPGYIGGRSPLECTHMLCILLLHHLKEPMAVDIQTCAMKTGKPPALQRLLDTNSKWAPVPGNLDCRCGSPIKEWVIKRRCKQVSATIPWWVLLFLHGFPGTNTQGRELVHELGSHPMLHTNHQTDSNLTHHRWSHGD